MTVDGCCMICTMLRGLSLVACFLSADLMARLSRFASKNERMKQQKQKKNNDKIVATTIVAVVACCVFFVYNNLKRFSAKDKTCRM